MTSLINSFIGEYRIVDRLGEGGMGEVYRAVHSKIGRVAAVKVMSRTAGNRDFVDRFLNEARIQARLQHPNIATLFDFLELQGRPCIIMEYVEGETLADLIRLRGPLPRHEALPIFRAVVDALNYVHSQGVIHRDIKSTNIKITPLGEVKLLDFGIAKSGNSPALTMTGAFIGTLQYISPEQFSGGIADARSDIWALGVLLYEMSTGRLPFDANSIGGLYEKIKAAEYPSASTVNPHVPRETETMIGRCLRRSPSERYQSARELLADMNRLTTVVAPVGGGAGAAMALAPGGALNTPMGRRHSPIAKPEDGLSKPSLRLPIIISAALLALIVIGGTGAYFLLGGESGSSPVAPSASPTTKQPDRQVSLSPKTDTSGAQSKMFTLEVSEGQADVYQNGLKVGITPYQFPAQPGDQVKIVLKRDGFIDKPVELSVSENRKVYTFSMSRKQ